MNNSAFKGTISSRFTHEIENYNNHSYSSLTELHTKQLKILVIDDHRLFADGISSLLQNYDEKLSTEFVEDIAKAFEFMSDSYLPDLILLGINSNIAADINYSLIKELEQKNIDVPVMILSSSDSPSAAEAAIENNASGFISKNSSRRSILEAILSVLNGNIFISKPKQKLLDNDLQKGAKKVTKRQHQVLCLLSKGLLNKQIAWELDISENTVKAHLSDLFRHLQVNNRTAAVKYGYEYGLLV